MVDSDDPPPEQRYACPPAALLTNALFTGRSREGDDQTVGSREYEDDVDSR
jgi:hypothetical protein